MNSCNNMHRVETWFDSGAPMSEELSQHLESCNACSGHLAFLESTRNAFQTRAERIREHQLHADRFLQDFRDRNSAPERSLNPRWALASLVAASFIAALALMSIVTPAKAPVEARSLVESTSTDVEGATTETYHADDGTAIVWVNVPEGDMW
jgi:anti-sigma factor RsiW